MKYNGKNGISILILSLPAIFYLFPPGFGSNLFDIPVYYEQAVYSSSADCAFSEVQHYILSCSLRNHDHNTITDEALAGHITVVDFFFPSCPDICPIMTSELSRVASAFRKEDNFKILSFSVDPTYDSPEVL